MPENPTRLAAALTATIVGLSPPVAPSESKRRSGRKGPTRIMYIECKAGELVGAARIGRVSFSKTWKTIYYRGRVFQRIPGGGFKSNYFDKETGSDYWISGPKKDGSDRLHGERLPIQIDDDVRDEYWCITRNQPDRKEEKIV